MPTITTPDGTQILSKAWGKGPGRHVLAWLAAALRRVGWADALPGAKDGVEIFYKDRGSGQPIVFHHGWPLSSDDWDAQMLYFVEKDYRKAFSETDFTEDLKVIDVPTLVMGSRK